ncbi:MAG: threonine synthase, partial [Actinomycetota bacterium]|nr:threonine synthase [Actinomycetota bacterium]
DRAAVVAAMLGTGGRPVVAGEDLLVQAHALGRRAGYGASPTGTAGLAGALELLGAGAVGSDERVVVLFTGA